MSDLHTLGVDPGAGGAAALLSPCGSVVLDWLCWAWLPGKGGRFRVRGPGGVAVDGIPSMHDVGCLLAAHRQPYRLVLEELFTAHGNTKAAKAKRRALIPLAESAGELLGPLRARAVGEVLRPNAQRDWRPAVLGLPRDFSAAAAEERAVSWARRNLEWEAPLPVRGLTYAEEGAVCEAACMAVWGWRQPGTVAS